MAVLPRPAPVHVIHPLPSVGAALFACIGVAASLLAREETGRGRSVETSLMAGALLYHPKVVGEGIARHVFQTHPSGSAPFYSVYECKDGEYIQLGCVHEGFIASCANLMGIGDMLGKVTGQRIAIPIMVTGFADVITWDPGDGVTGIKYRVEDTTGLGSKVSTFVKLTVGGGAKHLERKFDWGLFPQAVAKHGALAFDESFVFVPLLSLGGPKDVEHLQPRTTIEAIRTMVEFQGVVEH